MTEDSAVILRDGVGSGHVPGPEVPACAQPRSGPGKRAAGGRARCMPRGARFQGFWAAALFGALREAVSCHAAGGDGDAAETPSARSAGPVVLARQEQPGDGRLPHADHVLLAGPAARHRRRLREQRWQLRLLQR